MLHCAEPAGEYFFSSADFGITPGCHAGWTPSLQASKALYSLLGLTPGDTYDAAAFTITADAPPPQFIVGLEALVPACPAYAAFFPALALLGPVTDPRFPPPDAATAALLPFPVPPGFGVILRSQPEVANRSVFADNPVQSYLLPSPVTRECLPTPEAFAACGGGTAAQTSIITQLPGRDAPLPPGRYFIAWWDPARWVPLEVLQGVCSCTQLRLLGVLHRPQLRCALLAAKPLGNRAQTCLLAKCCHPRLGPSGNHTHT